MSLFEQKKKTASSLKALSENEIQKKLYGNLRPELLDRPRGAKPQVTPQPTLGFNPAASASPRPRPEVSTVRPTEDLFDTSPREESSQPQQAPVTPKKELFTEKSRMDRLAQLAEIEGPGLTNVSREAPWKKKPASAASLNVSGSIRKASEFGGKAGGYFAAGGKNLVQVLFAGAALLIGAVQAFDLRKPVVRRVIYWTAGAAALFSIFMGIHLLNVRREEAMKAPQKPAVKKALPESSSAAQTTVPAKVIKPEGETLSAATPETKAAPAQASASETKTEKKPEPASSSASAPAAGKGRYVIQIATFAGPNDAERVQKTLKGAELPVFLKALTRPSGRVYYSVFMGRYATFDEAQAGFEFFRKNEAGKSFQDAFIRTID